LCGLGDGDDEAERPDLPDVVAKLAVDVKADLVVVALAEVDEPRPGVVAANLRVKEVWISDLERFVILLQP
jgi:hypothetical protein